MSKSSWDKVPEEMQQHLTNCPLVDLSGECERAGVSYVAAMYHRSKALSSVVAGQTPILNGAAQLSGDSLIISDVHLPRHDSTFSSQVLRLAGVWGLRQCIIAGDLYDMDMVGPFPLEMPSPSTADELDAGAEFLGRLAQQFERILWIAGNHDVRLLKLAVRFLGIDPARIYTLMGAVDRIEASPYHHCRLTSAGRIWQIEHPKNASVTPGSVGLDLAAKFLCNVIVAHGHTIGVRRDRSGRYTIIDSGGLFHLEKLPYVSLEHSRRPMMNQGAVIVAGGVGYLVDPLNSDWDMLEWMGKRWTKNSKPS